MPDLERNARGLLVHPSPTGEAGQAWSSNFADVARTLVRTGQPTATDDAADGHVVGDQWRDSQTGRVWLCQSAALGAAAWRELPLLNDAGQLPDGIGGVATVQGFANASLGNTQSGWSSTPIVDELPYYETFSFSAMISVNKGSGTGQAEISFDQDFGLFGGALITSSFAGSGIASMPNDFSPLLIPSGAGNHRIFLRYLGDSGIGGRLALRLRGDGAANANCFYQFHSGNTP